MEADFPRGGKRPKSQKVDGVTPKKRKLDKQSVKKTTNKADAAGIGTDVFKTYVNVGMMTTGVRGIGSVFKINEDSIILKTINGISITVPVHGFSEIYKNGIMTSSPTAIEDIVMQGQMMAFRVEKSGEKRTPPEATICPSKVNACVTPATLFNGLVLNAAVKSLEEKGVVFDLGLGTTLQGFAGVEALPDMASLHIGQVLLVRVIRESGADAKRRFVKLSAYPEMDTLEEERLIANHLMPGTVLHAEPTLKLDNGFIVTFKNNLKAFIHNECLPPRLRADADRLVKTFRVVVAVCLQNSPLLVVTAHPDIIALSKCERRRAPPGFAIGATIEADVYAVDRGSNVYLSVSEGNDKVALVTAKLTSKNMAKPGNCVKQYAVGSRHKLVVMSYSPMDRQVLVTDKKEALKSGASVNVDLKPGQHITASINAIVDAGLIVTIGLATRAYVSTEHVADVPLAAWKSAFSVGQRLKCRVLSKAATGDTYYVTAKPSLVNLADELLVTEYDAQLVGKVVVGYVARILPRGAIVRFFNNVKALLPDHEASKVPGLKVGTLVRGVIVKVDVDLQHMGMFIGEPGDRRLAKHSTVKTAGIVKPANICKALHVYTAKIVREWRYGTTGVAIEVSLPGNNIGRLHACELGFDDEQPSPETSVIGAFLAKHKNEYMNVRVIERVRPSKRIGATTMKALRNKRIKKFFEVTLVPRKLLAPKMRKKLIDFAPVNKGADVIVYFSQFSNKFQRGEVTPYARVLLLPESADFMLNEAVNAIGLQEANPIPLPVGSSQMCTVIAKNAVSKTSTVVLTRHVVPTPSLDAVAVGRVVSISRHPFMANVSFGDGKLFATISASGFCAENPAAHDLSERLLTDGLYGFKFAVEVSGDKWLLTSTTKPRHRAWKKGQLYRCYVVKVPTESTAIIEVYPGVTQTVETNEKLTLDDVVTVSCVRVLKSSNKVDLKVVNVEPVKYARPVDVVDSDEEASSACETDDDDDSDGCEGEDGGEDDVQEDSAEKSVVQRAIEALTGNGACMWTSKAAFEGRLVAAKQQQALDKKLSRVENAKRRVATTKQDDDATKDETDDEASEEARILHKERLLASIENAVGDGIMSDIDFDRLVLSNPNSAETWIQYMVHEAESGDIDRARRVAETALKTINVREDAERLNMMTAYLSLEAASGTEDTLKDVFNRALGAFDQLEVYKRLANIFSVAKNTEELEKLYGIMVKKFGPHDRDVWTLYGTYLFKQGRQTEGRALLTRALVALDKRWHLEMLSRFANLEYAFGDIERGKTMFEKALAAAPKRGDLWNVYIDKAIKYQSLDDVRGIFERVLALRNMGYHTVKNLYQKWSDFEALRGDPDHAKMVTERALQYGETVKKSVKTVEIVA